MSEVLARRFLKALWAEYARSKPNAVGIFFDSAKLGPDIEGKLDPFESKVRKSSNPPKVVAKLAAKWNISMADVVAAEPGPHESVSTCTAQPAKTESVPACTAQPVKTEYQPKKRLNRRRAVLIGVNYYGTQAELRGCVNDVHNMQKLLTETFRWDPSNIRCLTDDSGQHSNSFPSRRNIEEALRWLTDGVQPGDSLLVHFSGHGAQEEDPNGYEEDGMHETFCPVDFQSAGMMTDDLINDLIVKPLPEGARLTAVMDCCHSGTGMDLPYQHTGRTWKEETNPYHTVGDVQLFSGCEDDDTSADCSGHGKAGGAMTTALCDVLRSDSSPSYPELMQRLSRVVKERGFSQRPQLTSSQAFDFDRVFHLDDAVPNSNSQLGRIFRKKFPPQRRKIGGGLGQMLEMGAAVVGGMVVADLAMGAFGGFADLLF